MVSRVFAATPPSVPDDGDGRTKARGSLASRAIRVLSPRMEPPVRVEDGSTARTATLWPLPVRWVPSTSIVVDLPAPGAPVMPRRTPLPVNGNSSCTRWCAVLRWSARLLSISVIARASIARSPERTPRTRSEGGRLREAIDSSSPRNDHASARILQRHPQVTPSTLGRGAREGVELIACLNTTRRIAGASASLRGLFAVPEPFVEFFQQLFRSFSDHRARRKDRFGAGFHEGVIILWWHDAADHNHDVVATLFFELSL